MSANRPYIIGITGGIGSGKSEAAAFLSSLGATHVDADAISRELTGEGGEAVPEIREAFGDAVITEDGTLNRRALGDMVFKDPAQRRKLEAILHPRIQREMIRLIDEAGENGARVVILNVPLLFETGMDALCDETWAMTADHETRLARVMMRDRITRDEAEARVLSQMNDDERKEKATQIISTDRPIEKTHAELQALFQQALKRL